MKKLYYTIGEVCNLLNIKPHVIRYWETEFPQLKPRKDQGRNRQFTQEHIDILTKIIDMLYVQKYTIDGARQRLKQMKKSVDQTELDLFNPTSDQEKTPVVKPETEAKKLSNADKAHLLSELIDMKKQLIEMIRRIKSLHRSDK